jgi:hypothetical protein
VTSPDPPTPDEQEKADASAKGSPRSGSLGDFAWAPDDHEKFVAAAMEWSALEGTLRTRNRFFPDSKFVAGLVPECLKRRKRVPAGFVYRARLHPPGRLGRGPLPPSEIGPPPVARSNRLNPEGVPCLYAALESDTAVAEVRPWRDAVLTVGAFGTLEVEVLDLRRSALPLDAPASMRYVTHVLRTPVHQQDGLAYLGTQYLAERLKIEGVDGILYDSALKLGGTNIALFGRPSVEFVACWPEQVYEVSVASAQPRAVSSFTPPPTVLQEFTLEVSGETWVATVYKRRLADGSDPARWVLKSLDGRATVFGALVTGVETREEAREAAVLAIHAFQERLYCEDDP